MTKYEFDTNNPPPLSDQEKAELEALAALSDEDIDTSDIPPLTEEFWKVAGRGKFYKLTETDAETRFRMSAAQGDIEAGLAVLDKLDAHYSK